MIAYTTKTGLEATKTHTKALKRFEFRVPSNDLID